MQALDRLAKLRAAMENLGIDAVIIPTADPHLSEYVPAHWSLRAALSGFTGSAGMLLVSAEDAALIADSRYWEQAEKQALRRMRLQVSARFRWPISGPIVLRLA